MTDADTKVGDKGAPKKLRQVPIAWEALEDAFENNAHEVHSYLHLETGEVIRVVDGIADPAMHHRIMADSSYLRIDPVSSREQYRWMERFIATVEDGEFRQKLVQSIDGKGAFRRFKDVLMSFPVDRERWFSFRSERLRSCMEAWLTAHGIEPIERPQWRVPAADEAKAQETATGTPVATPAAAEGLGVEGVVKKSRAALAEAHRRKLHQLIDLLPTRELDAALAFLEFLRERRHLPRPSSKGADGTKAKGAEDEHADDAHDAHDDERGHEA
ncbi:MAG: UPF0158 family protein [Polyangiales bacterium]